tara:strand:- start:286 stop:702 length:417 start_codon:yes stop_codon:yes gene_type:complete
MSDSPLNLFGSRRRKKRRQAKLAAMNPAQKAAYQAKQQAAISKYLPGGMGSIAGAGAASGGGDVQSQISEINSKLDTLTGDGQAANNTIATPASDLSTSSTIDPMQAEETMMGGDDEVVDGSMAMMRRYKGSCKMKKK